MEVSNKVIPLNTSTLPFKNESLDYNIIEDMNGAYGNISILEIVKIIGHCELNVQAFSSQPPSSDKASASQMVFSKSLTILKSLVNDVNLDTNTLYPHFLLTFEIFNYNIHNCLLDPNVSANAMPLSLAEKINDK